MPFELTGVAQVKAKLAIIAPRVIRATKQAVRVEAEAIVLDAKRNYIPVRSGQLRNSARVNPVVFTSGVIEATFSVSGPHAIAIHELHSEHDPPSWRNATVNFRVGGSQYLSKPIFAAIPGMTDRIAARIKLA